MAYGRGILASWEGQVGMRVKMLRWQEQVGQVPEAGAILFTEALQWPWDRTDQQETKAFLKVKD